MVLNAYICFINSLFYIFGGSQANEIMTADFVELMQKKIIWREIKELPVSSYGGAFISTDMVIAVCMEGESRSFFDMRPVCFRPQDVSVMLPDHIISNGVNSEDYKALLVIISHELYSEFISHDSFRNFYKYRFRPCHSLDEVQYRKIMAIMNALKVVIDSDSPVRMRMIAAMLDVFFYELTYYRKDEDTSEITGQSLLFQKFYDLLAENYNVHHDVVWYADKVNLTPKYFSTSIRKATGRSAGDWIARILSLRAKSLIKNRHDLNMQQISTMLGFVNVTSFCRFFRRMNHMSPKEFRHS